MAVDERARRHLHEQFDRAIGEQAADMLMEELALLGREQLATRHDLDLLRHAMDAGFAGLRGEFAQLRGELRSEMATLRADLFSTTTAT